jgi:integrase
MQAIISASLIKQLRPAEKPFEVRDIRTKGFLLRVQPSGAMTFYCEYGRGKRIALGRSGIIAPDRARDKAKDILAGAHFGDDPMVDRRLGKAHTLGSYLDGVYEPWAEANLRTGAATLARIRASFGEFLETRVGDLTALAIERWRAGRLKRGTNPATLNRDFSALHAAIGRAVTWGLVDASPIASVKPSKVDLSSAPRYLLENEEARLRAALDRRDERLRGERESANAWRAVRGYDLLPDLPTFGDHLTPIVLTALNTGMRRGELFSLTWKSVDLVGASIAVHGATAKSGQTRHVPLNAEALAVLRGWREQAVDTAGLVFPSKDGEAFDNIRKSWAGVLAAAKISGFRFHDMRHHFASRLVMSGCDLNTVRELLGHSDIKMTLRYSHLAPAHKAAAVAKLVRAR